MDDITDQLIEGSKSFGQAGNINGNERKFMDFRTGNDILSQSQWVSVGCGEIDYYQEHSSDHYENGYRTYSAARNLYGGFEIFADVEETVDTPPFCITIDGDYNLDYSASYFGKQYDIDGVCDFKQTLQIDLKHEITLDEHVENPRNRLYQLQQLLSSKGVFEFDLFNIVNGEVQLHDIVRQKILLERLRDFQEFTRMNLDQFTKNTKVLH